jgi:hypothetical protein
MRCPRCGGEATFSAPFRFLSGRDREEIAQAHADPRARVERWGGWYVLVRFPDDFPWTPPPSGGYRYDDRGLCFCPACGYRQKHRRRWPEDAYYVCDLNGEHLWAWSRQHVAVLKHYVESPRRDPGAYPGFSLFLRHIPTVFLLAKHRDVVSRKLQRLLQR